jgi:hypothetical protein
MACLNRIGRTSAGHCLGAPTPLVTAFVKRFDALAPARTLAIVDLAEIQHVPLHRSAPGHASVLNDAPVAVLFAVLLTSLGAQKHAGRLSKPLLAAQETWSAPHAISARKGAPNSDLSAIYAPAAAAKFPRIGASCESRVKEHAGAAFL